MNDATAAGRRPGSRAVAQAGLRPTLDRRRVLQLMLALPAAATVVAGCSGAPTDRTTGGPARRPRRRRRADAALAAAVIAADPTWPPGSTRCARPHRARGGAGRRDRAVGGVPSTAAASTAPAAGPRTGRPGECHGDGRSRAGARSRGCGSRGGGAARRRGAGAGPARRTGRPRRLGRGVLRDLRGGARVSRGSPRRDDAEGIDMSGKSARLDDRQPGHCRTSWAPSTPRSGATRRRRLPAAPAGQARRDAEVHRELRGQIEQTLTQDRAASRLRAARLRDPAAGHRPGVGGPAARQAETDADAAWRSVLERSADRASAEAVCGRSPARRAVRAVAHGGRNPPRGAGLPRRP